MYSVYNIFNLVHQNGLRPCGLLVLDSDSADDLYYYRQGRHYIAYRDNPVLLITVDSVYGPRDSPSILEGNKPPLS